MHIECVACEHGWYLDAPEVVRKGGPGKPKRDELDHAGIPSQYASGASILELSRKYRCSTVKIIQLLDRAGVTRRRAGLNYRHYPIGENPREDAA
jgi:Mor family transcriptional regulator